MELGGGAHAAGLVSCSPRLVLLSDFLPVHGTCVSQAVFAFAFDIHFNIADVLPPVVMREKHHAVRIIVLPMVTPSWPCHSHPSALAQGRASQLAVALGGGGLLLLAAGRDLLHVLS